MPASRTVKRVLGELPFTAEIDQALRGKNSGHGGFNLEDLRELLPEWVQATNNSPMRHETGKKVLIYATLHYWLSHAVLNALALAGIGHEVALAYSPYSNWQKAINKFDLRKRALYVEEVLAELKGLVALENFASSPGNKSLPATLEAEITQVTIRDVQYSLQMESVDQESALFKLRQSRNRASASQALDWMQDQKPDVLIVPNGLILEFGAVHAVAKHLDVPVVSYEFGEQQDRIWLARDKAVMLQDTDALWEAKHGDPFSKEQRKQVEQLFAARQQADLFSNFYRKWQDVPSEGAQKVRQTLQLDERPVVLLAANVIGDSLTLGRAIFSENMSTWLKRTLDFFASHDEVQLVLRVHPGERNLPGPSIADLITEHFPELPDHMRVVGAEDPINTYDLIQAADLGLVYTTTVGLEMAMSGLPAIVVGQTHYRGKGFTLDPRDWDEYFAHLDSALADFKAVRLSAEQIEMAWHYAYRFFFDYPQMFPWHLLHFQRDTQEFALADLFAKQGQAQYRESFDILAGEKFSWEMAQ